jgi:hypothetical protein
MVKFGWQNLAGEQTYPLNNAFVADLNLQKGVVDSRLTSVELSQR